MYSTGNRYETHRGNAKRASDCTRERIKERSTPAIDLGLIILISKSDVTADESANNNERMSQARERKEGRERKSDRGTKRETVSRF